MSQQPPTFTGLARELMAAGLSRPDAETAAARVLGGAPAAPAPPTRSPDPPPIALPLAAWTGDAQLDRLVSDWGHGPPKVQPPPLGAMPAVPPTPPETPAQAAERQRQSVNSFRSTCVILGAPVRDGRGALTGTSETILPGGVVRLDSGEARSALEVGAVRQGLPPRWIARARICAYNSFNSDVRVVAEAGHAVDLDDAQAEDLLAAGLVERIDEPTKPAKRRRGAR